MISFLYGPINAWSTLDQRWSQRNFPSVPLFNPKLLSFPLIFPGSKFSINERTKTNAMSIEKANQ